MAINGKFIFVSLSFVLLACKEEKTSSSSQSLNATQQAGVQGPAGPQGPQGPAGPAGRFQAFDRPVPFDEGMTNSLRTENGWTNNTGRFVILNAVIQLHGILDGCKSASLELKWDANSPWVTYQHYFHESQLTDGPGDGTRYNTTVTLPPAGQVRVIDNSNNDCRRGTLYLGGTDGQRDAPWFFSVAQ